MKRSLSFWMPSILLASLSACAGTPVDQDGQVATVSQALGESTCPNDYTFNLNVPNAWGGYDTKTSGTSYGDNACTNAFTGLAYFQPSKTLYPWLQATYNGPKLVNNSPYPCNAAFVHAYFWHKSGTTWTQVGENIVYGAQGYQTNECVVLPANYVGPRQTGNGEFYAVSAEAGVIYSQMPVTISAFH